MFSFKYLKIKIIRKAILVTAQIIYSELKTGRKPIKNVFDIERLF